MGVGNERQPGTDWEALAQIYPEIATAGQRADFKHAHTAAIFPPKWVSVELLRDILSSGDSTHIVYAHPNNKRPTAALICIIGGYAVLHIYRLRPPKAERHQRR